MTNRLHWQAACLADDIRRWQAQWRARCRRWYHGEPGRHSGWQDYTTGQMAAIEIDLATRPLYTLTPARTAVPEPETDWVDALLRSEAPRLYQSDFAYWDEQWRELSIFAARWRAASAAFRRECGLPDRPLPISRLRAPALAAA